VLRSTVPPGVHFACDVLDPEAVVGWIRESGAARLELSAASAQEPEDSRFPAGVAEEGVL
jgi:hypothetical protein